MEKVIIPVKLIGGQPSQPANVKTAEELAAEAEAARIAAEAAEAARLQAESPEGIAALNAALIANKNVPLTDIQKAEVLKSLTTPPGTPPGTPPVTSIQIGETTYTLNATGDAVDASGNIFMTKADLDLLEEDTDDEEDVVSVLQNILNFKPVKDGVPVKYNNDKAGIASLLNDSNEEQAELLAQAKFNALLEENPDIKQLRDYKAVHGTFDKFKPTFNWKGVNITTLTPEQKENVILAERLAKGDDENIAKYYLESIKKDNKLDEFTTTALSYLVNNQTAQETAAALKVKADEDAATKKRNEYWAAVDTKLKADKKLVVNSETFNLPSVFKVKVDGKVVTRTIDDFQDYIKKPKVFMIEGNKEILTQHQYDQYLESKNANIDSDLLNALKRFLNYDDAQIIAAKARTNEVAQIKKYKINQQQQQSNNNKAPKFKLPIKIK